MELWARIYLEMWERVGKEDALIYAEHNIPPQFREQVADMIKDIRGRERSY